MQKKIFFKSSYINASLKKIRKTLVFFKNKNVGQLINATAHFIKRRKIYMFFISYIKNIINNLSQIKLQKDTKSEYNINDEFPVDVYGEKSFSRNKVRIHGKGRAYRNKIETSRIVMTFNI